MVGSNKTVDFNVLIRLLEGLGSIHDSDDKSLGGVRALQAYLSGCGLKVSDLLQFLVTDHYEERIDALEKRNNALVAVLEGPTTPPVPAPIQSNTTKRRGVPFGFKRTPWQNHEIEHAKALRERGYTYEQVAHHMSKELDRTFTDHMVRGLFHKKLKAKG